MDIRIKTMNHHNNDNTKSAIRTKISLSLSLYVCVCGISSSSSVVPLRLIFLSVINSTDVSSFHSIVFFIYKYTYRHKHTLYHSVTLSCTNISYSFISFDIFRFLFFSYSCWRRRCRCRRHLCAPCITQISCEH